MSTLFVHAMASTPAMDAVFDDRAGLAAMLAFEAALGDALADCGLIAAAAAATIRSVCVTDLYDIPSLATAAGRAGTAAIPLVQALTARVRARDPAAAGAVHWGATSQDAIDTALVLQMRDAMALVRRELDTLLASTAALAAGQRGSVMLGRTLLQPGPPTLLGLKAAGWLAALDRCRRRLLDSAAQALMLQFGGAVGTLSALGARGLDVAAALARRLDLPLPLLPWHTLRDSQAALLCDLAILVGVLGKIGRDIGLLMLTGEAAEPGGHGRGGSSTMPHKRNPTASMLALAAAHRTPGLIATLLGALPQEAERGLGNWQAEWATVPEVFRAAAAALAASNESVAGLVVFPDAMRANIAATGALPQAEAVSIALAAHMDRVQAHHLVEAAVRRSLQHQRPFADALLDAPEIAAALGEARVRALLDPAGYLGVADVFIDRVLAAHRAPAAR